MGAANGSLGGLAVIEETVYGTTPGTPTWIWQHPMPSTIGLRRPLVEPNLLSYKAHTARGYSGKFVDGDLVVGLELDTAVIGNILGLAGVYSVDHYTMGDGTEPDVNSISVLESFGGGGATPAQNIEYIHKGVKTNAVRINLEADSNSYLTAVTIGQNSVLSTGGTAVTPDPPAETGVFMPADVGVLTILSKVICLYSGVLEVLVPKTGYERRCMGGTMKQPTTSGRPDITWTFNCDLDDAVGINETGLILSGFVSGTPLGEITIGTDFVLTDCIMSGDFPPLKEGQIDFSISGTASSLEVYC